MAEPKFKVGDIVQLKSGGPVMTVTKVGYEKDPIVCTWFDANEKECSGEFPADALEPYIEPTIG